MVKPSMSHFIAKCHVFLPTAGTLVNIPSPPANMATCVRERHAWLNRTCRWLQLVNLSISCWENKTLSLNKDLRLSKIRNSRRAKQTSPENSNNIIAWQAAVDCWRLRDRHLFHPHQSRPHNVGNFRTNMMTSLQISVRRVVPL